VKKIFLMLLSILIISLFLISCAEEISDQEIETNLEQLSEEELKSLAYEGTIEENKALAGQASRWNKQIKIKGKKVQMSRGATLAKKVYLREQEKFIARMPSGEDKWYLTQSLNYKLKSGERFDKYGNIIVKLENGDEIALLGYPAEKREYERLQKYKPIKWKELEELKTKPAQDLMKLVPVDWMHTDEPLILKKAGESCQESKECFSHTCLNNICHGGIGAQCDDTHHCDPELSCSDPLGLGGLSCKGFAGAECSNNGDCYSNWCHNNVCQGDTGDQCDSSGEEVGCNPELECVGQGSCLPNGTECLHDAYCSNSERCLNNVCIKISEICSDGAKDYDEIGVDCGGICAEEHECGPSGGLGGLFTITSCISKCGLNVLCEKNTDCQSDYCYGNKCIDPLNEINPLFQGGDYHPQGFMYWAHELYGQGSFPFLPYLTPIKDQGERGTCFAHGSVGATEILLMDRSDLSEQNYAYESLVVKAITGESINPIEEGYYIGTEAEWPYNKYHCLSNDYHSYLLNKDVPCSNTEHQGIPSGSEFKPYEEIVGTKQGGCIVVQYNLLQDIAYEGRSSYLAAVLNILKYPLTFNSVIYQEDGISENGFVKEEFLVENPWAKIEDEDLKAYYEEKGFKSCSGDFDCPEDSICGNNFCLPPSILNVGYHQMMLVAFIPKEIIPFAVKQHPSFKENEDYFIVKNSWGTNRGDGGFLYVPGSTFLNSVRKVISYRYDLTSMNYDNCPPRDSFGVD
jgi:hypothetical protein